MSSSKQQFAIILVTANGMTGTIDAEVDANGYHKMIPTVWHGEPGQESDHTISATFQFPSGEVEVSGDVWRALEGSGVLERFVETGARSQDAKTDYWLQAARYAARDTDEIDAEEITSEAIRYEYLDSGCEASDIEEAVGRLLRECPELFDTDDAATAFLLE